MIAGRFAFQGVSEYLTWQKIKALDYSFPEGFDKDAKDFVSKLLVRYLSPVLLVRELTPPFSAFRFLTLNRGSAPPGHRHRHRRCEPILSSLP